MVIIESQKELLTTEIKATEKKLNRTRKKLVRAEKSLKKAAKASDQLRIKKYYLTIEGRKARVEKLNKKLLNLKTHQENNTIPTVIFGGRSLWKKVCLGQATREEWRNARQNRLYSRGDKAKNGNLNLRIIYSDGEFYLLSGISHLVKPGQQAPRITGKLWIPPKHRLKIWDLLLSEAAYTIELIKGKDSKYRAHITFEPEKPDIITSAHNGYLGIDTNPDGLAIAGVNKNGQVEPWPESFTVPYPEALHKFKGEFQVITHLNGFLYIKIPELAYSRSHRRTYLTGVLAKVAVDIAKSLNKPIALEKLNFSKDRLDANKKFNRMAANFPYQKIVEAIIWRALKEGVVTKQIWPAYTSTIGYWKYKQKYGVTTHHAAAYVIARRALGLKERITKELNQKVNSLPMEGKGMTELFFNQLDEKLKLHSDLPPYEQTSSNSVWRDLKKLAYASPV